MNYNCGHSDNQADLWGGGHCNIMPCCDEEHCEEAVGQLVHIHTNLQLSALYAGR
jgi:hypothetical protein